MKPLPEEISFFRCFVPINCGFPTVPAQDCETGSLFFRRPPRLYLSRCPKPYNFKLFVFLLNIILKTLIFCFDDCCDFECLQFCNLSNIHPWAVQTLWKSSKAASLFFFVFPLFSLLFCASAKKRRGISVQSAALSDGKDACTGRTPARFCIEIRQDCAYNKV